MYEERLTGFWHYLMYTHGEINLGVQVVIDRFACKKKKRLILLVLNILFIHFFNVYEKCSKKNENF